MINKLLSVALEEVGYLEKKNKFQLDSKTANVGYNNYTKYGRDMQKWVGSPFADGYAWCDTFVNWCFITAFGKAKAKELLCGWSAYTPTSAGYFKNNKQWYTKPQAGDVVFFKNSERICHTGIVTKVVGNTVYTVEGNTSASSGVIPNGGGVFEKSYAIGNSRIAGYGRPKYDADKRIYGIDVSENQGHIDFAKVKASGKQFVVLRSTKKNGSVDAFFEKNLKGCKDNSLDYSCYKFSYATTPIMAVKEAESVINLLNGRKMTIWYDVELKEQIQTIGKAGLTKVIKAFIDECNAKGYDAGVYCNLNWYNNYIDSSLKGKYKFWIARYGKNDGTLGEQYKPTEGFAWQYTSVGKVNGITGNVDLDVIL